MRLLSLPEKLQKMVKSGELSAGHGRALLSLESEKQMVEAAKIVVSKSLSVRDTETLVKTMLKEPKATKKDDMVAIYIRQLEKTMSEDTGHRISISHGKKRGKLTIEYYGNEDLEKVCNALKNIK
jgi:ParB family chromosome partitioning protein